MSDKRTRLITRHIGFEKSIPGEEWDHGGRVDDQILVASLADSHIEQHQHDTTCKEYRLRPRPYRKDQGKERQVEEALLLLLIPDHEGHDGDSRINGTRQIGQGEGCMRKHLRNDDRQKCKDDRSRRAHKPAQQKINDEDP